MDENEINFLLGDGITSQNIISFLEQKVGADDTLLVILLLETFKYCRQQYKEPRRISALMGTVYYTHRYFTASRWRNAEQTYFYFRESILCQSVESPPKGMEIFEPEDAKNALIFFFELYIRNLPLVRILHLPNYKLFFKLKEEAKPSQPDSM